MNRYKGKRILVIGTCFPCQDILDYLKSEGAYVVLADSKPVSSINYNNIVDKTARLHVEAIKHVIRFAKSHKIDAVIGAGKERTIEYIRIINEAIGNTYLHTKEQWQKFYNKINFRKACMLYDVPVPQTFFCGKTNDFTGFDRNELKFPIIVKPVDSSGGNGISICRSEAELDQAIAFAEKISLCGEIIIEEYIKGLEIYLTYVVQKGECRLVSMGDKYDCENPEFFRAIPDALVFPSKYFRLYMEEVDGKVRKMILGEGLNDCTVFFQGIYREGSFYIFESGLRTSGAGEWLTNAHYNRQNYLNFIVDTICKVPTEYNIIKDVPDYNGRITVLLSVFLHNGKITEIKNIKECIESPNVYYAIQMSQVGKVINPQDILERILYGIRFSVDNMQQAIDQINRIMNTLEVYDADGNDMIVYDFDTELLKED